MPAIISRTIVPRTWSGWSLFAVELGFEQERREVVAWLAEVLVDAGVEVLVDLARLELRLSLLGAEVDGFDHEVDELAEDVGVLLREARASSR